MRKKRWVLPLIFLGLCLLIIFFVINALNVTSKHIEQWIEQPFPDGRPYETGFNIENFPAEYRKMSLSLEIWLLVWYETPRDSGKLFFQNAQLADKWLQVNSIVNEKHPIVYQSVPEEKLVKLIELQDMKTLKEALNYLSLVREIEYGELSLWKDPNWMEAKQTWEIKETQAMILGTYLLFLDNKTDLNEVIYEELETLISTVGNQIWFVTIQVYLILSSWAMDKKNHF